MKRYSGVDVQKRPFYQRFAGYLQHFELKKYRRGVLLRFPHPKEPDVIPAYEDEVKLYQAFSEQTRWDQLLGVNYVADLN